MIATLTVRRLRTADVAALARVLGRAYESQQNFERRLRTYLEARGVATFVADLDGEPVGMVVGNDYGPIAYVSQMAVDPIFQRRGIGARLMDGLTAWADSCGFMALELDATAAGEPLYARYGFTTAGQTIVYHAVTRGGERRAARRFCAGDRDAVLAADARAFGADRSDVLRHIVGVAPNVAFVSGPVGNVHGYAVAQMHSDVLGPVVAPHAAAAAHLIDAARAYLPALHRISLPSDNRAAHAIVAARGYRCEKSLAHMVRGRRPRAARQSLFARINLGQG